MLVERVESDYEAIASLYGVTGQALRGRDRQLGSPDRWICAEGGRVVGAVSTGQRPDDRVFVAFRCDEQSSYVPLAEAAAAVLCLPLYTNVADQDPAAEAALLEAGFELDLVVESFRIGFDEALEQLRRAWIPSGFTIIPTDSADEEQLFTLANVIRSDVTRTDCWQGNRRWFHEELTEAPPFDPAACLVAIREPQHEHAGLIRIWRNPAGPRLGLAGVLPRFRGTSLAAALLKQALAAAATWDHETSETETSPSNRTTYAQVMRFHLERVGRIRRLVRHVR